MDDGKGRILDVEKLAISLLLVLDCNSPKINGLCEKKVF